MANNCPIIRARLYEELIEWDPSEYNRIKVYQNMREQSNSVWALMIPTTT